MEIARRRRDRGSSGLGMRNLLSSRQGTMIVAGVCAALAAIIIVVAINRFRDNADAANAPTVVLVANGLIQKGTSGSTLAASGLYSTLRVAQKHVSPGALTDAAALQGKVAVTDVLPGQQLTLSDFAVGSGVAAQLAASQRAIAVPLDSSHGLSGVIQPGDRVDVYAGFNVQAQAATGPQMRLLLPDVRVISTGSSSSNGGNVVLAVDANYAAEVAYASDNGKIWLVLRPGNAQDSRQTIATLQSILVGRPPISAAGTGRKP